MQLRGRVEPQPTDRMRAPSRSAQGPRVSYGKLTKSVHDQGNPEGKTSGLPEPKCRSWILQKATKGTKEEEVGDPVEYGLHSPAR